MIHRRLKFLLMVVLMAAGLTGCYIPASFDAEININRAGYYKFQFEGYLAEVTLFNQIQAKEITPEEEAKKVELLLANVLGDSATKEYSYFKQGHFKIKWEKEGDLLKARQVAFLRRNENMFSVTYDKNTKLVTLRGTQLSKVNAQRLADAGLGMKGQFRVVTDANVISHNAEKVKKTKGREKVYIWNIKTPFSKAPKLNFLLR